MGFDSDAIAPPFLAKLSHQKISVNYGDGLSGIFCQSDLLHPSQRPSHDCFYGLYSDAHTGKIHKTGGDQVPPPIIREEDHLLIQLVRISV